MLRLTVKKKGEGGGGLEALSMTIKADVFYREKEGGGCGPKLDLFLGRLLIFNARVGKRRKKRVKFKRIKISAGIGETH